MGLIDTVQGTVERDSELNQGQYEGLVQNARQMFGNLVAISWLLNNARSLGMAHVIQSWIGAGANQFVSAEQIENLLGKDLINQLASRVDTSPAVASAALSRILPVIVGNATSRLRQAA